MKRFVVLALIVLAASCKKGGEEPTPAFDTTLLPGQWKLVGLTTNPAQDGPAGKGVTDLLAAYRQQIGGPCIDTTRVGFSEQGKISRTTISDCVSKTNDLFGFAVNGTWQARGVLPYGGRCLRNGGVLRCHAQPDDVDSAPASTHRRKPRQQASRNYTYLVTAVG